MDKSKEIKTHFFNPGAMSIIQMGEELIGHPSTAINELVKNGYDADATNCKIYFHYASDLQKSFVFIYDNGNGMDETILFGDWLQPSVSSKRKADSKSELYKRNFLGSKGIGRLASMALGRYVTVVTKKENKPYCWITIDREAFKEKKLLSDIRFPGDNIDSVESVFNNPDILKTRAIKRDDILLGILKDNDLLTFSKGTLIVIENIDDAIKTIIEEDFINQQEIFERTLKKTEFYKSLATLITPLNLSKEIQKELLERQLIEEINVIADEKSSFKVEFGINLLPDQSRDKIEWQPVIPIPVLSVYDYRIFGKVSKLGDVTGWFQYNRLENDIHENAFDITYEEIKANSISGAKQKEETGELFPSVNREAGEYYFDIRVYDIGEPDNLEKLGRKAGFEKGSIFKSAFKTFQGIRISKNGFGVKPYGEEVKDWIGLSEARVQNPGQNVNTNQILGYVFFYSPENDRLEEKTNREGFQENTAFIEVRNTLQTIFKNLGRRRYNYRVLKNLSKGPSSKHLRPDIEEFLKFIRVNNNLQHIRRYSEDFMKEVTTSLENLEESLSFSERLASLGSGIELVYHEMAQPISQLNATKSSLNLKKGKVNEEARDSFLIDLSFLEESIETLIEFRKSLQPVIGKNRKKTFKPIDTFLKVCSLFKSDIKDEGIRIIKSDKISELEINDYEYSFWITFLNIINNAVYWLKKGSTGGDIRIDVEENCIVISNSGPPIDENLIDIIFEYGVTGKSEKNATGLGLAFTRSTLSRSGWEIIAENRKNGPSFIIKKSTNGN